MQARRKPTFLHQQVILLIWMTPLFVSLWGLMAVEKLHGQFQKLSGDLVQCQDGQMVKEESQDGQSFATHQENYNQPPYKPGSLGSESWEILTSVKSQFSPMSTYLMMA